jgi:hypothetical protein
VDDDKHRTLRERGAWTRDDCVDFLDISKRTFVEHEEAGDFSPIDRVWNGFGFPVPIYDPVQIKTWARQELLPTLDLRRIQESTEHLTGSRVIAWQTAEKVEARRVRYGKSRAGVGRKDELPQFGTCCGQPGGVPLPARWH